ncbi:MAG: DUF2784 domain-containing protein [Planctomycetaceae bacterium]|nr:DUF2784 domain-containing protein [Planctomycetaceae bacterium]
MNAYGLIADAIVCLHFAYVGFVIGGLLVVLIGWLRQWRWVRNIWFRLIHLAMIGIVVVEAWSGVTCPLTNWEQYFRKLAGQQTHSGTFIGTLVHDLLFYEAPPWVFTICYTAFGLLVLAALWLVPPQWRRPEASGTETAIIEKPLTEPSVEN